jgi:hypothetical protein
LNIFFLPVLLFGFFGTQPGDYEKAVNGDAKLADKFCSFYVLFNTGKIMTKDRSYIDITPTITYNLCKIGAEGGYVDSQKEFAYILLRENVPSLKKEAIRYFELSAKQGNTDAKEMLAEMYAFHNDVERDYNKAAQLYEDVVDLNHSISQCQYARLYAEGNGVLRSYSKAKELVTNGFKNAKFPMEKDFCSQVWKVYSLDTK